MKTPAEDKKRLIEMGKWADFVLRRDELKQSGVKGAAAHRQAWKEITGEDVKGGRPPEPTVRHEVRKLTEQIVTDAEPKPETKVPDVIDVFEQEVAGKSSAPMEWVLWVARNIERKNPDFSTCPDVGAFGLLKACRRSPVVAADFWKTFVAKVITKGEGEKDPEKVDGEAVLNVIDRILQAAAKARGEVLA
jgi:hypothetical protein